MSGVAGKACDCKWRMIFKLRKPSSQVWQMSLICCGFYLGGPGGRQGSQCLVPAVRFAVALAGFLRTAVRLCWLSVGARSNQCLRVKTLWRVVAEVR